MSTIPDNLKGAIWISGSCVFASIMVTMINIIGNEVNSTVIVAGRCIVGLVLLLPVLVNNGFSGLASTQLKLHLIRGVFVAIAINLGVLQRCHTPRDYGNNYIFYCAIICDNPGRIPAWGGGGLAAFYSYAGRIVWRIDRYQPCK